MHYRSNFLSKVVCRIDFGDNPALKGAATPEFSARIQDLFPVASSKATTVVSVMIGPMGSGIQQEVAGNIWEHREKPDGTKVVSLSHNFLSLEYGAKEYDHFPSFRAEFARAYTEFQALYHVAQINRIGLRFINEISRPEGGALDWNNLLKPNLIISVRAGISDGMDLLRSFHQIHVKNAAASLLVHYGLFNPDYPNPLVRRLFHLDIDASITETPAGEVLQCIDTLNRITETQFEASIEDGLREIMEVIND